MNDYRKRVITFLKVPEWLLREESDVYNLFCNAHYLIPYIMLIIMI